MLVEVHSPPDVIGDERGLVDADVRLRADDAAPVVEVHLPDSAGRRAGIYVASVHFLGGTLKI